MLLTCTDAVYDLVLKEFCISLLVCGRVGNAPESRWSAAVSNVPGSGWFCGGDGLSGLVIAG